MSESFVDLTYRGLVLGKRVKLAQVRPHSGYLEMPAPMPVGTAIAVTTDEGIAFAAVVKAIHEQTGGSDKPPGMFVEPALTGAAATWWETRVALADEPVVMDTTPPKRLTQQQPPLQRPPAPSIDHAAASEATTIAPLVDIDTRTLKNQPAIDGAEPPPAPAMPPSAVPDHEVMAAAAAIAAMPTRGQPVTVIPRTKTVALDDRPTEIAAPLADVIDEPKQDPRGASGRAGGGVLAGESNVIVDDGKRTTVMDAVDPAMLEQLLASSRSSSPNLAEDTSKTTTMDAVDLSALGLDGGSPPSLTMDVGRTSAQMGAVVPVDDDETSDAIEDPDKSKPAATTKSGPIGRRRKPPKKR